MWCNRPGGGYNMIEFTECGYETKIKFPFNQEIINKIKELPERRYNPEERAWYIPNYMLDALAEKLPNHGVPKWEGQQREVLLQLADSSFIMRPEIRMRDSRYSRMAYFRRGRDAFHVQQILKNAGFKVDLQGFNPVVGLTSKSFSKSPTLYGFQEEAVEFLMTQGSGLLALDMGLGKTITSLEYAKRKGFRSIMVVAPSSVCEQWDEVLREHFGYEDAVVINGSVRKSKRLQLYGSPIVIASFDILRHDLPELLSKSENAERLHYDCLIADEIGKVKNWKAKRSQALSKIVAPYVIGLTGTPVENKIEELYFMSDQIVPAFFGSFSSFQERYIVRDDWGSAVDCKNLEEVNATLKDLMFRRMKREVEADLPERVEMTRVATLSGAERKIYNTIKAKGNTVGVLQELKVVTSNPIMKGPLLKSSAKESLLRELLTEDLAGRKVIVFSQFKKNIPRFTEMAEELRLPYAFMHGGMTKQMEGIKKKFQKMDHGCLFLTDVGMYGMDKLQTADTLINFDLPWNPAQLKQREGRIERMGSEHESVLLIKLVSKDTLDDHIMALLEDKEALFDAAIDGIYDRLRRMEFGE